MLVVTAVVRRLKTASVWLQSLGPPTFLNPRTLDRDDANMGVHELVQLLGGSGKGLL